MSENLSYKLSQITLLNSSFKREETINFDDEIRNFVNIEIDDTQEGLNLSVGLNVSITGKIDENIVFEISAYLVGVFEVSENVEISHATFIKYNAPAIILPFAREHISNISLKGGLTPVLLPIINFSQNDHAE